MKEDEGWCLKNTHFYSLILNESDFFSLCGSFRNFQILAGRAKTIKLKSVSLAFRAQRIYLTWHTLSNWMRNCISRRMIVSDLPCALIPLDDNILEDPGKERNVGYERIINQSIEAPVSLFITNFQTIAIVNECLSLGPKLLRAVGCQIL